jgi:hypothetical protein
MPKDWVDAFIQGNKIGSPGLPSIGAVTEYRDTVGALFQGAIEGGNVKDVIKKANEAFQAIIDKEK